MIAPRRLGYYKLANPVRTAVYPISSSTERSVALSGSARCKRRVH